MQSAAMTDIEEHDILDEYRWLLEEPLDRVLASVPESIKDLIELIGLEATLKLVVHYGGQPIYVQQFDGAFRQMRNARIRKESNGANHVALSKRFGLSLSTIYDILRRPPEHHQTSMFGD